ncbi:ABC transporter ATP-binding protein [Streptomyces lunaelactis]|uniref:ABC transporter ATP-binding protein n=1 Tax=Streptomyces lunaelactis TaxID=1535768 RepID=UPI001584ACF5|nr:dipeptide ABC transporter ATP-binding protein [Streptomyces lunaelactis]NUK27510.1 dipeptide ABC transporter ATP-binding protein [Streptomyces lunaelactis]
MTDTKKTADDVSLPEQATESPEPLLRVQGLVKHFPIKKGLLQRQVGAVKAVDGIDFDVRRGETLGVVGESGCGKSTMGRLITRLLEPTGGKVEFDGTDITHLGTGGMRPLRRDVQMIFQDPYGSLNPRHTVGSIVSAPFRLQGVEPEGGIKKEVQHLLELVGLSPEHYNRYPHEFSGGQRQRIGIARALALKPKLVVADEPVSALDVSIQAQVVNLLDDLQDELGLTYVIIAHDLSVIRHVSDRIAVMYLGKIVELTDRKSLYEAPMHPYTKALLSAVPVPDPRRSGAKSDRILLKGDVPSPISPPSGCRFHTRCWKATEICKTQEPPLLALKTGHQVACHHPENAEDQAPDDVVLLSAREAIEIVSATPKSAEAEVAAPLTKGEVTQDAVVLAEAEATEAEAGGKAEAEGQDAADAKVAEPEPAAAEAQADADEAEPAEAEADEPEAAEEATTEAEATTADSDEPGADDPGAEGDSAPPRTSGDITKE